MILILTWNFTLCVLLIHVDIHKTSILCYLTVMIKIIMWVREPDRKWDWLTKSYSRKCIINSVMIYKCKADLLAISICKINLTHSLSSSKTDKSNLEKQYYTWFGYCWNKTSTGKLTGLFRSVQITHL